TASNQSAHFKVRVGLFLQGVQHVLLGERGEERGLSASLIDEYARGQRHDNQIVRVCSPVFVLIVLRLHFICKLNVPRELGA
ncbi:MAG: hypothetical protein ACKPKO_28515, partial [Candidatus Fonsibacter sp.]